MNVLLMAYGTPYAPEEVEPYYTDIRRGAAPRRSSSRSSPSGTRPSAKAP